MGSVVILVLMFACLDGFIRYVLVFLAYPGSCITVLRILPFSLLVYSFGFTLLIVLWLLL